jgi:acyl carrier protein
MENLYYYQNLHRIKSILYQYGISASRVKPQADLAHDLGLRSPEKLSLILDIEDALHTDVVFEDPERLKTVHDILYNLERKRTICAES